MKLKLNKSAVKINLTLLVFGVIYSLVSLVNHYYFRTYAFDLGIFNQAMFDYSKFDLNHNTVLIPQFENLLSDHMCLILILISPLRYIFGTYTLLIVQIASVLFGALGVYKYFIVKYSNKELAYFALLHFLTIWAIFSALTFDYHNHVVGVMMIPWFLYYFEKNKLFRASIFALLLIISKENMAFFMGFIALAILLTSKKYDKKRKWYLFSTMLFSFIYFFTVVELIIPSLGPADKVYRHFKYEALGANFKEALVTLVTEPLIAIKYLFINHNNSSIGDGIKAEFYAVFMLSGGFAAILYPRYLIMILIIFAQKMYNDSFSKWSVLHQYSIEIVPIVSIALFELISNLNEKKTLQRVLSVLLIITSFSTTLYILKNNKILWIDKAQLIFYEKEHYDNNFDVEKLHELINEIPKDAIVSAEYNIVPHLSLRDKIFTYPVVEDAEFIFLLPEDGRNYPHNQTRLNNHIKEMKESAEWLISYEGGGILVFKKARKE